MFLFIDFGHKKLQSKTFILSFLFINLEYHFMMRDKVCFNEKEMKDEQNKINTFKIL